MTRRGGDKEEGEAVELVSYLKASAFLLPLLWELVEVDSREFMALSQENTRDSAENEWGAWGMEGRKVVWKSGLIV